MIAAKKDRIGALTPAIKGVSAFLKCYVGEKGILDGEQGWAISRQRFRSTVLAYLIAKRILKSSRRLDTR